ncbi:MAG: hypothetical protein AAF628_35820 [Planctomycetota bacterium]
MTLHLCRYTLTALGLVIPTTIAAAQPRLPITDAPTRLANFDRHAAMCEDARFGGRAWRFIGPEIMSGRITDLAVPLDQPWTIYAASASGGVWRTINEGTTWEPLTDRLPTASIGAIALAPGASETVWIGTGESNIFRSSMAGTGVYRSDDGGTTWMHCGLAATHTIARICIDPRDHDVLWVAASGHEWTDNPERGVYKTTDGGETWERVLSVDDRTGCIDLVMHPDDPDVVYASMWDRIRRKWSDPKPGDHDGVWRTEDGGATWEPLRDGLPTGEDVGRIGLAISASQPDVLYALLDSHEVVAEADPDERDSYGRPKDAVRAGAQVYRSADGGDTWTRTSDDESLRRLFSTYGWVFGQIRVDPQDPDDIWVMGVPLMRSRDGGVTFERVRYQGLHSDHHAMWIDPRDSRHVVAGNDGGINISYDGGETWRNVDNLGCAQFYNVAVDMAEPFRVYGSIQDNGSWRGPSNHRPGRDAATAWVRIPGGEASHHQVDPSDPNTLYCESFYGRLQRATLAPRAVKTIKPKAADGAPPLRGQWLAPFTLSPHNPFVVYHGMQAVFRSVDRGEHWQQISDDLSRDLEDCRGDIPFQTITSLSESPLHFGLLYAGTDDGRVWMTPNGGVDWNEATGGVVSGKWVSRLVASAFEVDTVYCAQNGKRDDDFQAYLWRSRDRGATWEDIAGDLPGGPINVVREDPRDPRVLYVGTDLGVYVTLDGGGAWRVLGGELPTAFVHDLVVHPRDQVLVAATHGRGVWTLDLTAPSVQRSQDF